MKLVVTPAHALSPDSRRVEIVERKGLGHPDTICDALAEEFSAALCRFYLERFGLILHHNVDKALLWRGASRPAFGGGEVIEPFEVFLAGRATAEFKGVPVPVEELAQESCRAWLRTHLHALDPDRHVRLHVRTRPGSAELVDLYLRQRQSGVWLANDTSCGVGFAPLTDLERAVFQVERRLNASDVKREYQEIGEDIKVLGVRDHDAIRITLACAVVDRFVSDLDDYVRNRDRVAEMARRAAQQVTTLPVEVSINAADDVPAGNVYLTVTGTSAEAGDDGQVGRGNRANGLITPYRPMTMEAAAGKNPVTHVGKLYNVAARLMAEAIVAEVPQVAGAECCLASRIGQPVCEPQIVDIRIEQAADQPLEAIVPRVEEVAREVLAGVDTLWRRLMDGEITVY
jgi:S-adenosylmethionine synthetase